MVLEHSSISHVFPTSSSATSHDLEDTKPLADMDTNQSPIDEGYGTQMDMDEDAEEGGVRLDLAENGHGSEPTPEISEGRISEHSDNDTSTDANAESTTSATSNEMPTHSSYTALSVGQLTQPEESTAMDLDMDDLPAAPVGDDPWTWNTNSLNVDFAELPIPDFEETGFNPFFTSDPNEPWPNFASPSIWESPFNLFGSNIANLAWPPNPDHMNGSDFDPLIPITFANAQPAAVAEIDDLAYMDDWDNQQLVPDREHVHSVARFLRHWKVLGRRFGVTDKVNKEAYLPGEYDRPDFVRRENLERYHGDIQGIDWTRFFTTREKARQVRKKLYCIPECSGRACHICSSGKGTAIEKGARFFDFKQCSTRHIPYVEHWQLRNILAATSTSDIFYASKSKILHTSPLSTTLKCVKDLGTRGDGPAFNITTLAAGDDMLIAGSLQGEYALIDLASEYEGSARSLKGLLSSHRNGISNHVHLFRSRSSGTTNALFASNDGKLRTLDCYTNRLLSTISCPDVINCTATSPDGRLRVQVGDFNGSQIVDAITRKELRHLDGNTGDAFACAWADDGITVAVASQDSHVLVFDARNWSKPVADIACEMDCARSLVFSPMGGGRRTLVVAESSDFVSIVDARTWEEKQVIDMFGSVAGICFADGGRELVVGNADCRFGGIFSYRRAAAADCGKNASFGGRDMSSPSYDWASYEEQEWDPTVRIPVQQRYAAEFEDILF
jgi:hypothetical protein